MHKVGHKSDRGGKMKQRIQEQAEPKKLGGSVYITLSPVVRRVAGIEVGQAVSVTAEAGKIVIVKEEK
jgi:hypothetical protein